MRLSCGFRPNEQNRITPFQCVANALGQIVAAAYAAVIHPNFGAGGFQLVFQAPHDGFIFPSVADKNFGCGRWHEVGHILPQRAASAIYKNL